MTTVVFVAGPAGVGKTTLAAALAQQLDCVHLDFDVVSEPVVEAARASLPELGEAELLAQTKQDRYRALHAALTAYLDEHPGAPVVVSAPFTQQMATPVAWQEWGGVHPAGLLVWLHVDDQERSRRIQARGASRDVGVTASPLTPPGVPHLALDAGAPARDLLDQVLGTLDSGGG